eukprot:6489493-Amphidinium_carterae.1
MDLAAKKTQIVCQAGPLDIPFVNDLDIKRVGGPEDELIILGGEFTLRHGFSAAFHSRVQKSIRAWHAHKNIFYEPTIPFKDRFIAAKSVAQAALFWSLRAAYPTVHLLQCIDSHALKIARLTAKMRRGPDQNFADFNQESAQILRQQLGNKLNWSSDFIRQQGNLLGHCLRRPESHPEHTVLRWKNRTWSKFNGLLPAYTRVMQCHPGPAYTISSWWADKLGDMESLQMKAQDRKGWREWVQTVAVSTL